jgi:predicted small secreted protein
MSKAYFSLNMSLVMLQRIFISSGFMAIRRMQYAAGMNPSSRLKLIARLSTGSLLALATVGCQTSKGFGKDVEKLGDKIQEKSS